MEVQVATLCDSAHDYNHKLCIIGTFDTICSTRLPVVHPQCAIALRICFKPGDEGEHDIAINFIDDDGKPKMPPLRSRIGITLPTDAYFLTRNLVINIQQLRFDSIGQFSIDVSADGEMLTRIPLRVMLVEKGKQ
jgi:hypothetical protein